MKHSTDRILTTHAGSLPRPEDLVDLLRAGDSIGVRVDHEAFATQVKSAVADVVRKQADIGIDIISDGEQGKSGYNAYMSQRLTGFEVSESGPEGGSVGTRWDVADFPEFARDSGVMSHTKATREAKTVETCTGPITYTGRAAVQNDIANFRLAMQGVEIEEAFLPALTPGHFVHTRANEYYPTEEAYLYAVADAMKEEYKAIVDAGFLLQLDAPDLPGSYHWGVALVGLSPAEYHKWIATRVEVINHTLAGIPADRVRLHLCWGNYEGPHHLDLPLKEIVDVVLEVRAGAYSIEASNPRHAHEWKVWEKVKLPEGKLLIPGVIDTTTNFIEHPELVAQRITNYARLVGRENVIAGTDCGFQSQGTARRVSPSIAWAKLQTLAEGARLATDELWRR